MLQNASPEPKIQAVTLQPQAVHNTNHIEISMVEYTFFGALMLMGACIIGWFVRSAFKSLTTSNTDLKNSIEKLAGVATSIHNDLTAYKVEVAETFATKSDLQSLKADIKDNCVLRHSRREGDTGFQMINNK